ncbi:MAG: sigma-70 family RNA polymerase sigma factor [Planctomycetaceae bacterium]|nr:sigma-70 family RNA polymerase sigma factor [Planctomycetaceae bacterium]
MSSDVSMLLSAIHRGDSDAAEGLLPLVYDQLRELARAKLAQESAGQTLQATALVHEAYIRLVDTPVAQKWHSRKYFFAAAAEAMRRILIENARRKDALKRGGDWDRVDVSLSELPETGSAVNVLEIDEALTRLSAQDAQAAELVKLRYFTGLPLAEAAEMLEMSERSARRLWAYARSFLLEELSPET